MRRITDVETLCTKCGWMGTVFDCEPDNDGSPCCPECDAVVVELRKENER